MTSANRPPVKVCLAALLGAAALAGADPARADLLGYVTKPDGAFSWKLTANHDTPAGKVYEIHLVSQKWHDITWEHQLVVYQPKEVAPKPTMLLMNTGGAPKPGSAVVGLELARKCGAPVAILYQIPNQPLLGDRKEDALIAETFVRYLESKDESWPLLFPMVKSMLRAMDALQAFTKEQWKEPVKDFVVTGASKRGWTTWLTAAAGDPRVRAIAPMVFDVLNMQEQMAQQKRSYGGTSEMIHDYTERRLVPLPDTAEARKLWHMVDPYSYREKLTLPKLILLGTDDPYWTVDALNLYWDGLKGDKGVVYVPNAGHNLQQDGKDLTRAVNALAAFTRFQSAGKPMPRLTWKHDDAGGRLRLTVEAAPAPKGARLWVAHAPTRDFRKAAWEERKAALAKGQVRGEVEPQAEGFLAFYAELDYEADGLPYHLCTQVRVAGTVKKE
jgi:PhoPQ-activated pathogenicity-related protein